MKFLKMMAPLIGWAMERVIVALLVSDWRTVKMTKPKVWVQLKQLSLLQMIPGSTVLCRGEPLQPFWERCAAGGASG